MTLSVWWANIFIAIVGIMTWTTIIIIFIIITACWVFVLYQTFGLFDYPRSWQTFWLEFYTSNDDSSFGCRWLSVYKIYLLQNSCAFELNWLDCWVFQEETTIGANWFKHYIEPHWRNFWCCSRNPNQLIGFQFVSIWFAFYCKQCFDKFRQWILWHTRDLLLSSII